MDRQATIPMILKIEDLIKKYTGPGKECVKPPVVTKLTAPGENYLGIVMKVEAILKDVRTGSEEEFNAVAKSLNFKVDEDFKKNIPMQYSKEVYFYTEIVPTLQKFVKDFGLEEDFDMFPKLYAARKNLNDDENGEVDENAVILLENLHKSGFANADRTVGFDLESTKLILKDLALFHAAPIALKLKNPQLFEEKIKKHLYRPKWEQPPSSGSGRHEKPHQFWLEILSENEESKSYVEILEKKFKKSMKKFIERLKKPATEPFASIFHMDLWTNNTMQIFNKAGTALKNKFIDFQFYSYDSPLLDLTFFLWSSVQLHVITEHFDSLIRYYQHHFLNYLKQFKCDIEPFANENFTKELDHFAPFEMEHIMFMSIAIYGKKGEAVFDIKEGPSSMKKEAISEEAKKRCVKLIAEFGRRGWIKA